MNTGGAPPYYYIPLISILIYHISQILTIVRKQKLLYLVVVKNQVSQFGIIDDFPSLFQGLVWFSHRPSM